MDKLSIKDDMLAEIEAYSAEIAGVAGRILMERFGKPVEVDYKGDGLSDPVTEADRESENYLKKAITERFPDHNILGEESGVTGSSDSPFLWVLDPLDGTANFINGFPFFAVSVGVLWHGQPVAGSIFVSESHITGSAVYHAGLGNGSWCGDRKITIPSAATKRPLAEMPGGFKGLEPKGKQGTPEFETRNLGSIAVEMAFTAAGILRVAYFHGPKIWDVAAGVLLVKEAGGITCVRQGTKPIWTPFDVFRTDTAEGLKDWSFPVVTGAVDTVTGLVETDKGTDSPLSRLRRVFSTRPSMPKQSSSES